MQACTQSVYVILMVVNVHNLQFTFQKLLYIMSNLLFTSTHPHLHKSHPTHSHPSKKLSIYPPLTPSHSSNISIHRHSSKEHLHPPPLTQITYLNTPKHSNNTFKHHDLLKICHLPRLPLTQRNLDKYFIHFITSPVTLHTWKKGGIYQYFRKQNVPGETS